MAKGGVGVEDGVWRKTRRNASAKASGPRVTFAQNPAPISRESCGPKFIHFISARVHRCNLLADDGRPSMQRHGALKRPLRSIIKSIGTNNQRLTDFQSGIVRNTARDYGSSTDRGNTPGGPRTRPQQNGGPSHPSRLEIPSRHHHGTRGLVQRTPTSIRHEFRGGESTIPRYRLRDVVIQRRASVSKGSRAYSTTSVAIAATRATDEDGDSPSQPSGQVQGQESQHDDDRGSGAVRISRPLSSSLEPVDLTPSFEEVLQLADLRPADGEPRVKSGDELKPRYFASYRSGLKYRLRKSIRRWQMQKERHLQPSSDNWRRVLPLLEDATPTGEEHFRRRIDTVDLPDGASLRFKINPGTAILEIMQQTGSHVQTGGGFGAAMRYSRHEEDAFSTMNLLGTPQQNSAALKILPQYVEVIGSQGSGAGAGMNHYALRSPDKSYWDEQDNLSEAEVEKLENMMDQVTGSSDEAPSPASSLRAVWTEDRLWPQSSDWTDRILKRPHRLTAIGLTMYIEDLTQKLPRLVIQRFYRRERPTSHVRHVHNVTEELASLLTDYTYVQNLTTAALDRALQFLTKHSKFHVFRKIFVCLEDSGYDFAPSNWNTLLAAAAKAGDIFNFQYVLKLMLGRGVPITPVTWALFHDLMTRRFPLEAGVVVEAMRKKGLLVNAKAASLIAANSAGNDLTTHLALKGDLPSFYRLYDNRFGLSYGCTNFEWLNINVVHRACHVLLGAGLREDAFSFLDEFRRRNQGKGKAAALHTDTLNTFLTSALRDRDPATAIAILRKFRVSQPGAMTPDHVTYSILFCIAWRRGYYNMLRVIWRYACIAGHAGYMMQGKVRTSLLRQPLTNPYVDGSHSARRLWDPWAGKFAVGIHDGLRLGREIQADDNHETTSPEDASRHLWASERQIVRLASQIESQDVRDPELNKLLNDDFKQVRTLAPVRPFADLLEQAFEMDRQWKEEQLGLPLGLPKEGGRRNMFKEMMRRGIEVPVVPGDYTKEARQREDTSIVLYNPVSQGP